MALLPEDTPFGILPPMIASPLHLMVVLAVVVVVTVVTMMMR
jgi:hypothetical protein